GKTLFRNEIWGVHFRHRGSGRVHPRITDRAPLDFAKATGSAPNLIPVCLLTNAQESRIMNKTTTKPARLIVAASDQDPDILYATKFWAPDPFIFLQRNGKRTLVLSDLEIDRGRRQAEADEFVMFSEVEREVQGKSKKIPPYEKVLAHFLKKRGVRSVVVPSSFPLRYAEELATNNIRVRAADGLYWPEREAKSDKEIDMMRRALRITEAGLKRAMEVLKASKPASRKRLHWNGKTLTSEMLRAEIDSAVLRAGGIPTGTITAGGDQACDPHEHGHGP